MIDENNFDALVDALRRHPDCAFLSVWRPEDFEAVLGMTPDQLSPAFRNFEERSSEMLFELMSNMSWSDD